MSKACNLLLCCALCAGCAGSPGSVLWREGSPIDYARLFQIAHNLIAPTKAENLEGLHELDAITGLPVSQTFLTWYSGVKLVWSAANALRTGRTSRSLAVQAVVSCYKEGCDVQ
jgi:hypothetical protein